MKNIKRFFLLILMVFILVSCKADPEYFTGLDVDDEVINTSIQFQEIEGSGEYTNGLLIMVQLRNLTSAPIAFDGDYGIAIFLEENNDWELVQNDFNYPPEVRSLFPEAEFPAGALVAIIPDINSMTSPQTIRLVVHGTTESGQVVVAAIDLLLQP